MLKNSQLFVDESEIASLLMWSVVTGIIMIVSGFSYRTFLKRKNQTI